MALGTSRGAWIAVALLGAVSVALVLSGQETGHARSGIGMVHDWSHRHVVFSNPTTIEQGMRVRQDPRFWQQHFRRNVQQALPAGEAAADTRLDEQEDRSGLGDDWLGDLFRWKRRRHNRPSPPNTLKRDWATSLGPNATVGAGNYPAKFSFDISSANCGSATQPDFVVFNTSVQGSSTQASIVAFDNLYSGCGGTVPKTYWSYNTGGAVVTSVVLSLDGSQIAFVQTPSGSTNANLVLLKWKPTTDSATSTTPDVPSVVATASQYPTCTTPCMVKLPFSGGANDTNSSPFYDYTNDALYVGDDNGSLHKFQPVFRTGVPAEVGSPWPVLVASGLKLTSPVFDGVSGRVFVGSSFNGSTGTQLFGVNAQTGAIPGTSSSLGKGVGIVDGPIVDSSAGKVYAFVGADNSTGAAGSQCFQGGSPCAAVYQFAANFTSGSGIEAKVSTGGNGPGPFKMYNGTFDNAYFTSSDSTGTLYVCGNITGIATLYRISVNAGVMSTTSLGGFPFASAAAPGNLSCGPLTEIFNSNQNSGANSGGPAGTDKLFVSTVGPGTTNPCFNNGTGGCILDLAITAWRPGTIYSLGQEILDTNLNIQVVTSGGLSGATQPTWPSPGSGGSIFTVDGSVQWVFKEGLGITGSPIWSALTSEPQGTFIVDPNGNTEVQTSNFLPVTGVLQPTWPTTIGVQTTDGTAHWVNAGPVDNFYLPVAGGTSGSVVDNTVPAGTLGGASQMYFSPLSPGFGTCGAGNGCAVQASQSKLN
jgi:hypothetical protein